MKSLILLVVAILSIGVVLAVRPNNEYEREYEYLNLLLRAEAGEDVSEIYKQNPSYAGIEIYHPMSHAPHIDFRFNEFRVWTDRIHIQHYETAVRVLKAFGHLTPNIEIIQYQEKLNKNLMDLIVIHCSDTLKYLKLFLDTEPKTVFERFTKPFTSLEKLYLYGGFETLNAPNYTFPKLFPMLKHIDFVSAHIRDNDCLDHQFEHLETLTLLFSAYTSGPNAEGNFRKLIKKNPNIRNLKLYYTNNDFVKFISNNLRQLQQVDLLWSDVPANVTDVYFRNAKKVSIDSVRLDDFRRKRPIKPPGEFFFTNAEEFEVDSFAASPILWTEFLARSVNLRKLHIVRHELNDTTLDGLNSIAPNLTDFSANLLPGVKDETMLKFVKSHPRLLKVRWLRDADYRSAIVLLRREIGNQWGIVEISHPHPIVPSWTLVLTRFR